MRMKLTNFWSSSTHNKLPHARHKRGVQKSCATFFSSEQLVISHPHLKELLGNDRGSKELKLNGILLSFITSTWMFQACVSSVRTQLAGRVRFSPIKQCDLSETLLEILPKATLHQKSVTLYRINGDRAGSAHVHGLHQRRLAHL